MLGEQARRVEGQVVGVGNIVDYRLPVVADATSGVHTTTSVTVAASTEK